MLEYTPQNEQQFFESLGRWIKTYGHNPIPGGLRVDRDNKLTYPDFIIDGQYLQIFKLTDSYFYYPNCSLAEGNKKSEQGLPATKLTFRHVIKSGMHKIGSPEEIISYPLFFDESHEGEPFIKLSIDSSIAHILSPDGLSISKACNTGKMIMFCFNFPSDFFNYSMRGSRSYSPQNEKDFIAYVREWVVTKPVVTIPLTSTSQMAKGSEPAVTEFPFNLAQNKIRRHDSDLPFSILSLGEGDSRKYVAISNMQAGKGARGRVKVVYPLTINSATNTIKIEFNQALALKIISDSPAFKKDDEVKAPTDAAVRYYKTIHPDYAEQYRISCSTKHETHPMARLEKYFKHHTYDNFVRANKKYYTMPLYAGIDGFSFFKAHKSDFRGRLTLYGLLTLLHKMAQALKHLHDQQLIHCDLKQNNFLVDWPKTVPVEEARVYLIDCDELGTEGKSYYRSYIPSYCPPEISTQPNKFTMLNVNRAHDIYSLAVTIRNIFKTYYGTDLLTPHQLKQLLTNMTEPTPCQRVTIDTVIVELDKLRAQYKIAADFAPPAAAAAAVADKSVSFTFKTRLIEETAL